MDTLGMTVADGQTFRWKGRYAADLSSRETLDTQLNVFASFRPELPTTYRDSRLVLLGNIHPELQLRVLDQVSEPWLVAADTMNYWIDGTRAELLEVLRRIDTLIINDEEVRQLAGIHNLRRAAKAVLELGPRRLIVKRGEYGAMLFDDHGMFFAPAYPTDTEVDPTGAGDTFAGALLGYLASQGPAGINRFRLGLLYASAVAAFCVEGVGTRRLESVRADQVAQRVKELETLVSFR